MSPLLSTILGSSMLILGAIAVYTMLSIQGSRSISSPKIYLMIHRISGWLFATSFLVVFVFMLGRIQNYWELEPPRINTHVTIAVFLSILLAFKVIIPRFFPKFGKYLIFLGISVYIASFTLVGVMGGYYVIRKSDHKPYISHANVSSDIYDEKLAKELFIEKCSTCHILENIMDPRSEESWEKVVNDMIKIAEPRINIAEGTLILRYLTEHFGPKPLKEMPKPTKGTSQSTSVTDSVSLVDKHCLPCHKATEIFSKQRSRTNWTAIVKQMTEYDSETVPAEKTDEIVDFLLKAQQNEK